MILNDIIFLDHNSTTPVDPRVLECMLPYFNTLYANPSSSHSLGKKVKEGIDNARKQVSDLIGCKPSEIIFTSGATEAINLYLKGIAYANSKIGQHIITTKTEHKAVLDTCSYLESIGYEVTYLSVDTDGLIDLNELKSSLRDDTILVSIMMANNETGVIQDVYSIATEVANSNALFFTDATQFVGKLPIDINTIQIDGLAFSSHKIYGPKGIGALYIHNSEKLKKQLQPLIHGGGHENGIRSGTINVPGIIGFGKACDLALKEMSERKKRIEVLRNELETALLKLEGVSINGSKFQRMYNVANLLFKGWDANMVIARLKNICISNGSACNARAIIPSHVLTSMGLSEEEAFASLRFSIGNTNTPSDISNSIMQLNFIIKNKIV